MTLVAQGQGRVWSCRDMVDGGGSDRSRLVRADIPRVQFADIQAQLRIGQGDESTNGVHPPCCFDDLLGSGTVFPPQHRDHLGLFGVIPSAAGGMEGCVFFFLASSWPSMYASVRAFLIQGQFLGVTNPSGRCFRAIRR